MPGPATPALASRPRRRLTNPCSRPRLACFTRMRYWDAGLSFVVAAAIAAVLTPLAARLARRLGAVDVPRERGLAWRETPLLGGLAILVAVLVAAAIWMPGTITLPRTAHAARGVVRQADTWGLIAGACLIALVGAIDDIRELTPLVKLVGQIAAAIVAVRAGRSSPV